MASKIKHFLYTALMAIMIMVMIPATVLATEEVTEVSTWEQFIAALADSKENIKLTDNLTVDSASGISIPSGTTIDGAGYSITAGYVGHGSSNALFVSGGSISVKNLTVKANGSDEISCQAFSMGNGGSLSNVEIEGFPYGVSVGSTAVTISGCTFNNTNGWGIYNNATSAAHKYTNNTFNGERAVALYGDEEFTGNTVTGAKGLSVASATAEISGNTFSGARALNISATGAKISGNNFSTSSKIEIDSGKTADLSGNYWGGDAPAGLPNGVTWENYYKDSTMDNANLVEKVYAAQVGTAKFETLGEALSAAAADDTITLLADTSISGQNALDKLTGKTLDLNDKTLTVSGNSYFSDGTTTFTNGKIIVSGYASDSFFCGYTAGAVIEFDDVNITGNGYTTGCAAFNANLGTIRVQNSTINLSGDTTGGIFYGGTVVVDDTDITSNSVLRGFTNSVVTIKDGSEVKIDGAETGLNNSTVTINGSTVTISNATKRAVRLKNNTLKLENGADLTATGCVEDIVAYDENSKPTISVSEDSTLNAKNEAGVARIGDTNYPSIAAAIAAANVGDTVIIKEGTYPVPSMKAGITIEGEGDVLLEGTFGNWETLENLTLRNLHIKGGNAQRWSYAKGNLLFENVTFEATGVYALHFDGITAGANLKYKNCTIIGWAAMSGSPASCVFEGCTIKGNGTYGVIRTYFDATIRNCIFDVDNVNTTDVYQDGIHAVGGAVITATGCKNVNGSIRDIANISGTSVIILDDETIQHVAKIGNDDYYRTLVEAFEAAQTSEPVKLIADVNENVSISKTVELDLNGNKFTGTITLTSTSARLTAPEGLNVTAIAGYKVVRANGVYKIETDPRTVTFDANGGEGTMTEQTFLKDVAQALKANEFTRKNFYFTGWMDDEGNFYTNKQAITITKNTTLYAQWARVPSTTSYTVQYNANGGTGSVYLQAFTSSMTFELRMNEFVREGYKFVGWNTKADGTGDAYAEGASFSGSIKRSIVLYAQWKLDVPEFPAVRPEYKIEVEGQEGKIIRTNDTSIVFDKMFIRWSIGFDTVDGPFAMIAILDVVWTEGQEGLVGTFTIPVIQTNGTISGVNYMLTTDPNANMVGVGDAAKDMYGMLIK